MEWLNRSEVLFGKCVNGEISPNAIEPHILHEPYDRGIMALREGATESDLMDVIGMVALDQAKAAAKNINGDVDKYVIACRESSIRVHTARELDPVIRRWGSGANKEGDIVKAQAALGKMDDGRSYVTPLGEAQELGRVWRKTGYDVWDTHFMGLPESSLTVIGAPPKTGKTSLLGKLLIEGAKNDKTSLFFSLEMRLDQIRHRFEQMDYNAMKSTKRKNKILCVEDALTLEEIYAEAGRVAAEHGHLHIIGVDFADMIIPKRWGRGGEVAIVDETYRTMAAMAKQLDTPVVVLSQLSGSYIGGRPRVNHLRGSRLIEALAAMVVMVYNPDQIDLDQDDEQLYAGEDVGWLILGASRYGYAPMHKGPVGVAVHWKGEKGWGDAHGRTEKIFAV